MISLLGKTWQILDQSDKPLLEKLRSNRGLASDETLKFHDPFLFSDMEKAIARIIEALEKSQRIMIFGDYDVDGISASALLYKALKQLGTQVSLRLPNRVTDGYGLSDKFIDEFITKEISLIITVDCGIACKSQIARANQANIDTIITDHHTVPTEIPEAYAIIHPLHCQNYPFKGLTGAGVAYKLVEALSQKLLGPEEATPLIQSALELASLGTVADLGPLKDENRLIVKEGLKMLSQNRQGGLYRLKQLAGLDQKEITAAHIGFQIAPRINSAGRIGDPYRALFLLTDEITNDQITAAANYLEDTNEKRRNLTKQAEQEIETRLDLENPPPIIIEHSQNWHVGILGLIAGRLAEKTHRPVIALADLGQTLTASARAPHGINIIHLLRSCEELLLGYGGHEQAAGFSIAKHNLAAFQEKISALTAAELAQNPITPTLKIDAEIYFSDLDLNLLSSINTLAPFGQANEEPIFLLKNLPIENIEALGTNRDHLKIFSKNMPMIGFQMGKYYELLQNTKTIDLVCKLLENNFRGRTTLELQIIDLKLLT